MENEIDKRQVMDLIHSYENSSIDLNHFCFESELMIEKMKKLFFIDHFSKAMNCVYTLEEINALSLDEERSITQEEHLEISNQLNLLKKFIA